MEVLELANHADHWHQGQWWGIALPFLWFFLIVGTISFFKRRGGCGRHHRSSGESVLQERYAKGEISEQEYRDRLSVLRERRA